MNIVNLDSNTFRTGEADHLLKVLNPYSDSISQYTPYRGHAFDESTYRKIYQSLEQFGTITASYQSNVGAYSIQVLSNAKDEAKNRLEENIQRFLYTSHEWQTIQDEIIEYIVREGNAILMLNEDGKLIVHSHFRFNIYRNPIQKTVEYRLLVDGVESVVGLKDGVDLWHFKDKMFQSYAVAPSRIDLAYAMVLLESKAVKLNTKQFESGWMSNILLQLNERAEQKAMDETKDDKGRTWIQRQMAALNDTLQGWRNAFRPGYVAGLKGIFEVGKSPRDAQFIELLKLTPQRIAWAYSMTETDFGTGGSSTYNNVSVFNDRLYDLFGAGIEKRIEACWTKYLFPLFGINLGRARVAFRQPPDGNENTERDFWRLAFVDGGLTLNEYREKLQLPAVNGGDEFKQEQVVNPVNPTEDPQFKYRNRENFTLGDALQNVEFKAKNPTEKAIASKKGAAFETRWEKAFKAQIDTFANKLTENIIKQFIETEDTEELRKYVPKIESSYSFKALNEDLLYFAGVGIERIQKDDRVKTEFSFKQDEKTKVFTFDGEYPDEVLEFIEMRTIFLLKGVETYTGIDGETTSLIAKFIRDNAELGEEALIKKLKEKFEEESLGRARTIVRTEIANAVMGTNSLMYEIYGATSKKLLPINDDRSRISHLASGNMWVALDKAYQGGFMRAGEQFNCRCDEIHGFDNEHLEDELVND